MQERNLKEVLQKKEESTIKQKMELLYQEILNELLVNQKSLIKTERIKLFVTISNYIFSKTKSVKDQFTIKQLKKIEKQGFMDRDPDLTKYFFN